MSKPATALTALAMGSVLLCPVPPRASADSADPNAGDTDALTLRADEIAADVLAWRVVPDSAILLMQKDGSAIARVLGDDSSDNRREVKLSATPSERRVPPLRLLNNVRRVGPNTIGYHSLDGKLSAYRCDGFTLAHLASGRRRILGLDGRVATVPVDANTSLLIEHPLRSRDPNDQSVRVHRLDLGTLQPKRVWDRSDVTWLGGARLDRDDPNKLTLWYALKAHQPPRGKTTEYGHVPPAHPITRTTLDLRTGKASEITLDPAEARKNGMPARRSGRSAGTGPISSGRQFHSPDGKATVRVSSGQVLLSRRNVEGDLFTGDYTATVYPSSGGPRPRRLAIVKKTGQERELYVMDLKTLDKTKLTTFTELDSVKGWSPGGRFLVAEQYSPTNLDDHGHLVVYEPARWRKTMVRPGDDQKYISLLGFVPGGWAVVAGDTIVENAIRKTRLSVVDLADPKRRYAIAEGKLFRVAAAGERLVFSDFDGESYTLYRCEMPERKITRSDTTATD
jgi:hypothetical protein